MTARSYVEVTQAASVRGAVANFYMTCGMLAVEVREMIASAECAADTALTLIHIVESGLPDLPGDSPPQMRDEIRWHIVVCSGDVRGLEPQSVRMTNAAVGALKAVDHLRGHPEWADSLEEWCLQVEEHAHTAGSCAFPGEWTP